MSQKSKSNRLYLICLCAGLLPAMAACDIAEVCRDGVEYLNGNKCATCPTGKHINEDADGCEDNTDKDCGSEHTNCTRIKNVKTAVCDKNTGTCTIQTCKEGFKEALGACVPEAAQSCSDDSDCPRIVHASAISCKSNFCDVTCETGFHLTSSGECADNSYVACNSEEDCKNTCKTCEPIGGFSGLEINLGVFLDFHMNVLNWLKTRHKSSLFLDTNQKNRVKKRFLHEKIVFLLKKGYFCIQNLCIFRFKE